MAVPRVIIHGDDFSTGKKKLHQDIKIILNFYVAGESEREISLSLNLARNCERFVFEKKLKLGNSLNTFQKKILCNVLKVESSAARIPCDMLLPDHQNIGDV